MITPIVDDFDAFLSWVENSDHVTEEKGSERGICHNKEHIERGFVLLDIHLSVDEQKKKEDKL